MMNDKTLYNSIKTSVSSAFMRNGMEYRVFSVTHGSCAAMSVRLTVIQRVFDITHRATADPEPGSKSCVAEVINEKLNE